MNAEPLIREAVETVWTAWTEGRTVESVRCALVALSEAGNAAAGAAALVAFDRAGEPLTLASAGDIMLAARKWGATEAASPRAQGFGTERRAAR